jgi:hypothetical protein
MQTSELLHYSFRARDPEKLAFWYADLFEGQFFVHPVMTGLGLMIVKINHPEALLRGLLEFWPWDVAWDGRAAVFRKIQPQPSPTSYGHVAVKVKLDTPQIIAELNRRGIPHRMEPRGPGVSIPVIDDPEGNMIELFPNIDHMDVPPQFLVGRDQAQRVIAQIKSEFQKTYANRDPALGYPLMP